MSHNMYHSFFFPVDIKKIIFSLEQATKAQRESRDIALLFL